MPRWAHPRSRGDDIFEMCGLDVLFGSPPLARGRRHLWHAVVPTPRLTPARAGTTPSLACRRSDPSAHPRSRGDDGDEVDDLHAQDGSPPLARGRQCPGRSGLPVVGLTPARAGTTPGDIDD